MHVLEQVSLLYGSRELEVVWLSWNCFLGPWSSNEKVVGVRQEVPVNSQRRPLFEEDCNEQIHRWRRGVQISNIRGVSWWRSGTRHQHWYQKKIEKNGSVAPEEPFGFEVGLLDQQQEAPAFGVKPKVALFGGRVWWRSRGREWGMGENKQPTVGLFYIQTSGELGNAH